MLDLRTAAEALLQTAQIHQQNFETVTAQLQTFRSELEVFRQRQRESDQRFEIMLSELRQMKIDSDARFVAHQAEIERILDRLFPQEDNN
jgi:hypothetical protein